LDRERWQDEAKGVLHEQGGGALLVLLRTLSSVGRSAAAKEALRLVIGYFEKNEHRTDYPSYRAKGWDIGSGPTEAGCKRIGARLKGSGMRWFEEGAATVGALRALYLSGSPMWDGFGAESQALAA
jgi:hypothetical protein